MVHSQEIIERKHGIGFLMLDMGASPNLPPYLEEGANKIVRR